MYRILITICLFMPLAGYCQESSKASDTTKSGSKKKDAKLSPKPVSEPAANPRPDGAETVLKMPADVVEVRPDIFRRVDENGKVWIYRHTPFGIQRSVESENMRNLIADPPDKQMVKEMPDGTIEFSKLTPFGVGRYTRKKEDLNEEEKEIWEKYKLSRDSAGQKKNAREQQK